MQKEFDLWNIHKQKVHAIPERPLFKEREVWWCSLGVNVGDEQDGKGHTFSRPVLVLKKFNRHVFIGVPFSTQIKDNRYYHRIHFKNMEQSVILSQIRLIDAKRFGTKIGEISPQEVNTIKARIKKLIFEN